MFRWTREEKDNLLKYYNQSRKSDDAIAKITEKYEESGMRHKTQLSIITELLEQNIISEYEYDDLMRNNKMEKADASLYDECDEKMIEEKLETDEHQVDGDVKVLKEFLFKDGKGKFVLWLQGVLMETCYVKLVIDYPDEFRNNRNVMEPSIYYFASK